VSQKFDTLENNKMAINIISIKKEKKYYVENCRQERVIDLILMGRHMTNLLFFNVSFFSDTVYTMDMFNHEPAWILQ